MNWVFGVFIAVLLFLGLVFWVVYATNQNGPSSLKSRNADAAAAAAAVAGAVGLADTLANAAAAGADPNFQDGQGINEAGGGACCNEPIEPEMTFNKLYETFGFNAMDYISGSVQSNTSLNQSITKLSMVLCSREVGEVERLYLKKINLLKALAEKYKQIGDLKTSDHEIENLKKQVRECADQLSRRLTKCLDVSFKDIRNFYSVTDSLIIRYAVETKTANREIIKLKFSELTSELTLN